MSKTIVEEKQFWKSKMFWLGIVQVGIGILQYIQGQLEAGSAVTLFGIMTVILRFLTKQPLKMK